MPEQQFPTDSAEASATKGDEARLAEYDLNKAIDARITKRVAEEKIHLVAYLKITSVAAAIAGTVIVAALAFIGWKSTQDIAAKIDESVKSELGRKLEGTPPKIYMAEIQRLYEQALLDANLATLPPDRMRWGHFRINIPPRAFSQQTLIEMLCRSEVEDERAQRALDILRSKPTWMRNADASCARRLVLDRDPPNWIKQNPNRLALLISLLSLTNDSETYPKIQQLLADSTIATSVRLASLEYFRSQQLRGAEESLLAYVSSGAVRDDFYFAALRAIAAFKPDSEKISRIVEAKAGVNGTRDLDDLLAVISELGFRSEGYVDVNQEWKFNPKLKTAFARLIGSGTEVKTTTPQIQALSGQTISNYQLLINNEGLDLAISAYVKELLRNGDFTQFDRLIKWVSNLDSKTGRSSLSIRVYFYGGIMKDEKGMPLDIQHAGDGLYFTDTRFGVMAHWRNSTGSILAKPIKGADAKQSFRVDAEVAYLPNWLK